MTAVLSMLSTAENEALLLVLDRYLADGRSILLHSDLTRGFYEVSRDYSRADLRTSALRGFFTSAQECVVRKPWFAFALREAPGEWKYVRIHAERLVPEEIPVREFLRFKERLVVSGEEEADDIPEIDLAPFMREFPRLTEPRSIGQGLSFLNRQLAGHLFSEGDAGMERLHDFLAVHQIEGRPLLLRSRFKDVSVLRKALRSAIRILEIGDPASPWSESAEGLAALGFEPGWGDTSRRAVETMELLADVLEAPSGDTLEAFLARIPMISRLLIVSPHGYFGQANVLGLPDTGGQVIYILDQVRALESEMRGRLARQGVCVEPRIIVATRLIPDAGDTSCNQRMESIEGTKGARILRVPFRYPGGEIVRPWVSRFEVWPFLERFARELEHEAQAELGGRPDLILGNYSDGNLVASLLGQRLGVTTATIAHALEKTKYLLSALYWRDNEAQYHFSCQYTADLIAMNSADFIITSTYQEIAGTSEAVGQYESYSAFTMPGLYRVTAGTDIFDPRYNIVSPGADAEVFFPYTEEGRRLSSLWPRLEDMVFGPSGGDSRGSLRDPGKTLLFTMARLDRIKNVTGLVELYASSERLRSLSNLLVVAGQVNPELCSDREEASQACRMHDLMNAHGLDSEVRWVGRRLERQLAGELFRFVADRKGVFVQPALFEAFGLTVVEAMTCGLPVFATCHGGPAEVIEHGRSGFHIDPVDGPAAASVMASFLERCVEDPSMWDGVSAAALARVDARYTWKRYAEQIMTFARMYGFLKFVQGLEREETNKYLHLLYHLLLRPRAAAVQPNI